MTQGVGRGVNAINIFIDVAEVRAVLAAYRKAPKEQEVVAKPDPTPPPGGKYTVKLFVPAKVGQTRFLNGSMIKKEVLPIQPTRPW